MSISYIGRGTNTAGTTSTSPTLPASITTDGNSILLLHVANKYPAQVPTTPSGWTPIPNASGSGGAGAAGVDSGTVLVTSYYLIPESTPSAPTVTVTGGNSVAASIELFQKTNSAAVWSLAATNGADNTAGTAYSATGAAQISIITGDMLAVNTGTNSNLSGAGSARSITATSATIGSHTSNANLTTSQGDHLRLDTGYASVTAGSATAAPVYSATFATTAGNYPAGATNIIRMREVAAVTVNHNFDGTAGQNVTVNGAGANALTEVYRGSADLATITYDSPASPRGSASCAIATTTSSAGYVAWDETVLGEGNVATWGRVYLWMTADFAASVSLLQFAENGTARGRVQILTDRKVRIVDSAGATVTTTTSPIALNSWIRIECKISGSTSGDWSLSVYAGNSVSAIQTLTGSGANFGGAINTLRVGVTAPQANVPTFYLDDLGFSTAGALGPVVLPNVAPTANAGSNQTVDTGVTVTLTGSATDDNGTPTLSWAQTSGPSVTLQGSGGTVTFESPPVLNQTDLVFTLTASDGSLSGTDTVTITVMRATEVMWNGSAWVPLTMKRYSGSAWE